MSEHSEDGELASDMGGIFGDLGACHVMWIRGHLSKGENIS